MSDITSGTEDGVADPENHLTAEDAGSTTDPADLVDEDEKD